jgi:iron complex outermembrane receptor protein
MANLERIEVLKGPASILYGRIQPGGMINLVTKKPLEESYYSIQQQVGSYDFYRTALDATSKLNESGSLLYRFNMSYENKGSFREFIDDKKLFIAPVVQWKLSERTQITFDGEYSKGKVRPDYGTVALGNRPANLPIERNLGESFAKADYTALLGGFNWSHEFNSQWKIQHRAYLQSTKEDDQVVLPLALQADNETLDRFFAGFQGNKHKTYTTSLDLTGHFDTFGLKHRLLLGGDYYQFKNAATIVDNFAFPSINIFNPVHGGNPIPDPADNFVFDLREKWFGLYLQDQVELPFHLHLLAGLRYDSAEITTDNSFGGTRTVSSSRQSAVTPRVGSAVAADQGTRVLRQLCRRLRGAEYRSAGCDRGAAESGNVSAVGSRGQDGVYGWTLDGDPVVFRPDEAKCGHGPSRSRPGRLGVLRANG